MEKINAWLVFIAGILLILNVLEVISVLSGVWGWILALVVTAIGILKLKGNKKRK